MFSGELGRKPGEDVGTYVITQGSLVLTDNYIIGFQEARLTISHRLLEITAGSATKIYDGTPLTNHSYEITGGSLAEGDYIAGVKSQAPRLRSGRATTS